MKITPSSLAFSHWLNEVTVYHGSKSPIDKWDSSRHLSGYYPGFYTWPDAEKAKLHGPYVYKLDINDSEFFDLEDADDLKRRARKAGFPSTMGSGYQDVAYLKSLGYKGLKRGDEHIVFHPEQWAEAPMLAESMQTPSILYHHAPKTVRESIQQHGLSTKYSEAIENGIFLTNTPRLKSRSDVWEVDVRGLEIEEDWTTTPDNKSETWWVAYEDIPPSRLRLMSPTNETRQLGRSLPEVDPQRYGHRNAKVAIYRATTTDVVSFKPKDYVTLNYGFARGHAKHTAEVEEEAAHVLRARVLASEVFEAYNPGEFFYDGPETQGEPIYTAYPTMMESAPDLSYLLGGPGKLPQIGPESVLQSTTNGISIYVSPHGSYRFLYMKNNMPIAALQVVTMDGQNASIANVWTDPEYRRKGLATQLLNAAKEQFAVVKHHDDVTDSELSDDGKQWKSSFE